MSLLLRGHELEQHPLVYDKGCWTDVDALLSRFNECRDRRWGVRQLLRAAKADKKGRIRSDKPLFPVRIRVAQGHSKKLVGDADTDLFLATRFFSLLDDQQAERMSSVKGVTVLPFNKVPKRLYHRTNERGMNGILQNGRIPEAAKSSRSHNYLSAVRLNDADHKSGMRSNQPIELAIGPIKAMEAGCEFFVTETEGVLTRGTIPPSCIVGVVDTTKKDLPLYVAAEKEATCESEPDRTFRAKRDYEEAASSSSAPPKAVESKKMPKPSSKPEAASTVKLEDVAMDDDATREGEGVPRMLQKPVMRVTPPMLVRKKAIPSGRTHVLNARRSWPTGCYSASAAGRHRQLIPQR